MLSGHNVRPKLRFRRTWAGFSRTLSNDRQLFAALGYPVKNGIPLSSMSDIYHLTMHIS